MHLCWKSLICFDIGHVWIRFTSQGNGLGLDLHKDSSEPSTQDATPSHTAVVDTQPPLEH